MSESLVSEKLSHKSLQTKKQVHVLKTFTAFTGTIATYSRSSDSTSVSCTDSRIGQTAAGVLTERLQRFAGAVWCDSVLFELLFPC